MMSLQFGTVNGTVIAAGTALLTTINPIVGFTSGATFGFIVGLKPDKIGVACGIIASVGATFLLCQQLAIPLSFKAALILTAASSLTAGAIAVGVIGFAFFATLAIVNVVWK